MERVRFLILILLLGMCLSVDARDVTHTDSSIRVENHNTDGIPSQSPVKIQMIRSACLSLSDEFSAGLVTVFTRKNNTFTLGEDRDYYWYIEKLHPEALILYSFPGKGAAERPLRYVEEGRRVRETEDKCGNVHPYFLDLSSINGEWGIMVTADLHRWGENANLFACVDEMGILLGFNAQGMADSLRRAQVLNDAYWQWEAAREETFETWFMVHNGSYSKDVLKTAHTLLCPPVVAVDSSYVSSMSETPEISNPEKENQKKGHIPILIKIVQKPPRGPIPLSVAVPFGKGVLIQPEAVTLRDNRGILVSTSQILEKWEDGSIRLLLLHFIYTHRGRKRTNSLALWYGSEPKVFTDVRTEWIGDFIVVDTGVIRMAFGTTSVQAGPVDLRLDTKEEGYYMEKANLLTGMVVVPEVVSSDGHSTISGDDREFYVNATTNPVFSRVRYENLRGGDFVSGTTYTLYHKTSLIHVETSIEYQSR